MEIPLLAKWDRQGDNSKMGRLSNALHWVGKRALIASINHIAEKHMKDVIRYKRETGWKQEELTIIDDAISNMLALDEKDERFTRFAGNFRDILLCIIDEDTHYALRTWAVLHEVLDRKDEFDGISNRSYGFKHYLQIRKSLEEKEREVNKMMAEFDWKNAERV